MAEASDRPTGFKARTTWDGLRRDLAEAEARITELGLDSPYFAGVAFDNPDTFGEVVIDGEPYVPLRFLREWKERALAAEAVVDVQLGVEPLRPRPEPKGRDGQQG